MRGLRNALFSCLVIGSSLALSACGGSSSGNDDLLIQGTLKQGSSAGHSAELALPLKHGAGEPIEEVQICAAGDCTITDLEGKFGLVVDQAVAGTEVLFDINGHGIDTQTVVAIPSGVSEFEVELERHGDEVHSHSESTDHS